MVDEDPQTRTGERGMNALTLSKQSAYIAAFGRLLMALIFLISGAGKIATPTMTLGYIASPVCRYR